MKKVILTLATGILLFTSCKKEEKLILKSSSNEYIEFSINGTPYSYTGNQVGDVNEPSTTWETRIQSAGNASHFELLLNDTIMGTYSQNASNITILFTDKYYAPKGTNGLRAVITKYDTVGGYIEGTFEGHAKRYLSGNDSTEVDFTNGKFKVIRDFKNS